jgi:DUF3037 family protein
MSSAFYSVVQFCPSLARGEGVNVGVTIVSPRAEKVVARFSSNNERVKRVFGADAYDDGRLTSAKTALHRRLVGMTPTEEDFRVFIGSEANSLVLSPPRPIIANDLDVEIVRLFDELVGERPPQTRRRRPASPDLEAVFLPLLRANIPGFMKDVDVTVPRLGQHLRMPYAYTNGGLNYIKGEGFAGDEEALTRAVQNLATQGQLLAKHPIGSLRRHLIIVARFEESDQVERVRSTFEDFDVRLVLEPDLPQFAQEVRSSAHN